MPKEEYERPRILGHEATGTIVEVGPAVQDYHVGQRVAMNFRAACGACYYCRNGMEHFCVHGEGASGSFAEYAVYPESAIYLLPDDLSCEIGALLEPVSVAVHAIDRAHVRPGSTVAICGGGPIGLLCLEWPSRPAPPAPWSPSPSPPSAPWPCASAPTSPSILSTRTSSPPARPSPAAAASTPSSTPAAASAAARQAIDLADRGATILWAAVYGPDVQIGVSPFQLYARELTITSTFVSPYSFPRALNLLPKLDLAPLITHTVPLAEIRRAFDLHKTGQAIKILVQP